MKKNSQANCPYIKDASICLTLFCSQSLGGPLGPTTSPPRKTESKIQLGAASSLQYSYAVEVRGYLSAGRWRARCIRAPMDWASFLFFFSVFVVLIAAPGSPSCWVQAQRGNR